MQDKATIQGEIVKQYLDRFPDAATLTLARLIYRENHQVWTTLEACRASVRYARGNSGARHRKNCKDKSKFRPNGKPGDPFGEIPEGEKEIQDYVPYVVTGPCDSLILSDIHVPYHDKSVIVKAFETVKKPDLILLNGDFGDFFALSKWEKDPRKRDFAYELECARVVLEEIRKRYPKARIILKLGNHDERYERYMELKAPELLGVADFELERLLRCDALKIEVVKDKRPVKLGKIFVIHGHEYPFAISNPVNPARGLFLRALCLAMCGHFHQSSQHSENSLDDRQPSTWSVGCACNLHPLYRPLNKWNQGFARVIVDENGAINVENFRMKDGKAYR